MGTILQEVDYNKNPAWLPIIILITNLVAFFFFGIERSSAITQYPEGFGYVVGFVYVPFIFFTIAALMIALFKVRSRYISFPPIILIGIFLPSALLALSTHIIEYPAQIHEPLRTIIIGSGLGSLISGNNEYQSLFTNGWLTLSFGGTWVLLVFILVIISQKNSSR